MDRDDLIRRVRQYADRRGMVLGKRLRDAIHLTEVPAPETTAWIGRELASRTS
jgi:hypothetical protein